MRLCFLVRFWILRTFENEQKKQHSALKKFNNCVIKQPKSISTGYLNEM